MLKNHIVTPPPPLKFELHQVLRNNGYRAPAPRHFTHLRNYLRDSGYIRHSIVGRAEYWIFEATMSEHDRKEVAANSDSSEIWTVESYGLHVLGMQPPFTPLVARRIESTLYANGFAPRRRVGQPTYWSARAKRRAPVSRPRTPPAIPAAVGYPLDPFTAQAFLTHNQMRPTRANFDWARQHLPQQCLRHGSKWVRPDARGEIPVTVSGAWLAPGAAFTTAQFQRFNGARRVTAGQWLAARRWLDTNGYVFNPRAKRWVLTNPPRDSEQLLDLRAS